MKDFDYYNPLTLKEATVLYGRFGAASKLLLGGTDLVVLMKDGVISPDVVIDLKSIDDLKRLELKDGFLHIGARTTFSELIKSDLVKEKFPIIWEASKLIASVGVINRATLVGNICSAVPSADSAPALLVRDAVVSIESENDKREIPISEFFVGPRKTVLKVGEIVTEIKVPEITKKFGGSYIKLGRYQGEDLAQVGVATLAVEGGDYRVAFCAVAPKPVRATEAEKFLRGKEITDELLEEAKPIAIKAISPISDVRASKEYRMRMSGVLFARSMKASVSRLKGNGSEYGERLV